MTLRTGQRHDVSPYSIVKHYQAFAFSTITSNRPARLQYERTPMDNPFMAHAIRLALDNVRTGHGGPFAALVVRGSAILAEGTTLVTATNDPTAHAEITAIRNACRNLKSFQLIGCDIYTTCEPCPMC